MLFGMTGLYWFNERESQTWAARLRTFQTNWVLVFFLELRCAKWDFLTTRFNFMLKRKIMNPDLEFWRATGAGQPNFKPKLTHQFNFCFLESYYLLFCYQNDSWKRIKNFSSRIKSIFIYHIIKIIHEKTKLIMQAWVLTLLDQFNWSSKLWCIVSCLYERTYYTVTYVCMIDK